MNLQKLEIVSYNIRKHIIKLTSKGGCFIGASLSCVEILTFLYCEILNQNLDKDGNYLSGDIFLLSKGHDVPTLYGLFVELGLLDEERLNNHLDGEDFVYWHPNSNMPGVYFHSGSLGHNPSIALGIGQAMKLKSQNDKVYVLLGDGELNEGTVWEAALLANAKKLDNVYFLIDRNGFQANMPTEELIPLEPIEGKFKSFGFDTFRCCGHDFNKINLLFSKIQKTENNEKPKLVIFDTIRGKGLPSIEKRADRWFCQFTEDEVNQLLIELDGEKGAEIKSKTLIVR
jgi:transketolase